MANGVHPKIVTITGDYPNGVTVIRAEMKKLELRQERSKTLSKYDILIRRRK